MTPETQAVDSAFKQLAALMAAESVEMQRLGRDFFYEGAPRQSLYLLRRARDLAKLREEALALHARWQAAHATAASPVLAALTAPLATPPVPEDDGLTADEREELPPTTSAPNDQRGRSAMSLASLLNAADRSTRLELMKRLGRHLLIKRPLCPGLEESKDEDLETSLSKDPWVDGQLWVEHTPQPELDGLDDAHYGTLEEAWPDGFDEVVFNDGEDDARHAEALVEAYLVEANKRSLPIMTDFESTDEEMEAYLKERFIVWIRKWRALVFELLT